MQTRCKTGFELRTYLATDFSKTLAKYDELWTIQVHLLKRCYAGMGPSQKSDDGQDPEDNPYKSKYVARELLEISAA